MVNMVQAMIFVTFWHFDADFTCAHGRIRSPIANSILLSPKISFTFSSQLDAKSSKIQQDRQTNLNHFAKLQILYERVLSGYIPWTKCQKDVYNSATFLRWSKPQTNQYFECHSMQIIYFIASPLEGVALLWKLMDSFAFILSRWASFVI